MTTQNGNHSKQMAWLFVGRIKAHTWMPVYYSTQSGTPPSKLGSWICSGANNERDPIITIIISSSIIIPLF
jgi:hypothetical protein